MTTIKLTNFLKIKLGVRHFQFFILFLTLVIFYGQRTCLSVTIIAMTEEVPPDPSIPTYPNWTNTDLILSSFFWGYIATQLGAGQLAEYFGPKWFLVSTMVLGSGVNLLVPAIAAWMGSTGVIICRAVQGLSQGFLYPSIHSLISRWSPLVERTSVASAVYSGSVVGIITSMLLSGAIAQSVYGWPYVFYSYSVVGLIWTLIFAIFVVNSPRSHKTISLEERIYIESTNSVTSTTKKLPTPWKSIFTSLPVHAIFVSNCGLNWINFTLLTEIPSFMSERLNFDIKSNGELSALPYIFMFLVGIVGAPFADRIIKNQTLTISTTRKIFNSIALFVPAVALLGLGFIDESHKVLAMVLLIFAVASAAAGLAGCVVNCIDLAPNHVGTVTGICNGFAQFTSILGPLSVGFLGNNKKDPMLWKNVFWMASGISVFCGLFYAVFGSGEVQDWNEDMSEKKKNDTKIRI